MDLNSMNAAVAADLAHIPPGDLDQNVLRSIYNVVRRADLAKDPTTPLAISFRRAVESARQTAPSFAPQCDQSYFDADP
jgi:hypothetical protein